MSEVSGPRVHTKRMVGRHTALEEQWLPVEIGVGDAAEGKRERGLQGQRFIAVFVRSGGGREASRCVLVF